MSNSRDINIEIYFIYTYFFKGEIKWEKTYCIHIRTPPWNKHIQYSLDLKLNLLHRNSHRKTAALHHLCSAHASLGTGQEKESPAKHQMVHLSRSSEARSSFRMIPLLTAFLLWPQTAAEVGRKEKWQAHNCFVAFSYSTTWSIKKLTNLSPNWSSIHSTENLCFPIEDANLYPLLSHQWKCSLSAVKGRMGETHRINALNRKSEKMTITWMSKIMR